MHVRDSAGKDFLNREDNKQMKAVFLFSVL